ncbi:MAG: WD40 repeat domain-containing protein, partial [Gammaproteobacteria bacterium]
MLDYAFKPLLQSIKDNHCTQVLVPGVGEMVAVQGEEVKSLAGHRDIVWAVTVLPDGTVMSGSVDNTLRHWDLQTGQCLDTWTGHTDTVSAVTVLPDGTVVSGSSD